MTEYIKCSNCKCKFINNDEHTKFDFGYNRLGKRFKCCVKCRENGRKHNERNKTHATCDKQNNLSDIEITQRHYEQVDKDLRKLYEQEFNIDSFDRNHRLFTREQQINRYAKMLLFWDKNTPSMNKAEHKLDAYTMAKMFYISDMRSQTLTKILSFPEELKDGILIEYRRLVDRANEPKDVVSFLKKYQYPSYDEVIEIIGKDKIMKAEYGEENHKLLHSIWNDIQNIDNIKEVGRIIDKKGKLRAMANNHWTFIYVVKNIMQKNKIINFHIKDEIYKIINEAWNGIGGWKSKSFS